MTINLSVQYYGVFLPDFLLLTQAPKRHFYRLDAFRFFLKRKVQQRPSTSTGTKVVLVVEYDSNVLVELDTCNCKAKLHWYC